MMDNGKNRSLEVKTASKVVVAWEGECGFVPVLIKKELLNVSFYQALS
ncbi:hypothetical protein [Legionella fairfieldensis]|nr:hypothetical protein [Legionella fairfieldensis]